MGGETEVRQTSSISSILVCVDGRRGTGVPPWAILSMFENIDRPGRPVGDDSVLLSTVVSTAVEEEEDPGILTEPAESAEAIVA